MISSPQKTLTIFVDETDRWHEESLYAALVRTLEKQGLSGASVISGLMGFGAHRHIHRKGLFGVSDDKPVMIIAVDSEEKIRSILPSLVHMVREGLIMLQDAEVISTGTARQEH